MPASDHPNLPINYGWSARESGWGDDLNDTLIALGALTQLAVLDRDLDTPPGSPAAGDRYLVAATATGAWAGHDGEVALYIGGAWRFYDPQPGWRCYVEDEDTFIYWNGTAWVT